MKTTATSTSFCATSSPQCGPFSARPVRETLALLQAVQQSPKSVLFATFSNELERLPGEFILVLDDYHTIHGVEVHNLLGELVRHWPKPLHLVLISRLSPPIPLDSLRAKGLISEIRTRDLRFTPEETASYLSKTQFALMGQTALPLLEERFEGWPAGLAPGGHLLPLCKQPGSRSGGFIRREHQHHRIPGGRGFEPTNFRPSKPFY